MFDGRKNPLLKKIIWMIKNEVAFLSHLIGVIKRHHHCSSQLNRYLYFMRELIKVQLIRV